jgi:hypothetical protein
MVILDTYNDSMAGFPNSIMTYIINSTIKQQSYRIINVNGEDNDSMGGLD